MNIINPILAACTGVQVGPNGGVTPCQGSGFAQGSLAQALAKGVNVFAFIIGALSVIMILVGALRYTLSAGNPQATKEAKDTILYAVIGVIITIMAFAIVRFVTGSFNP